MQPSELERVVAGNIRRRRNELGLTQDDLAERISEGDRRVFAPYISDLERGKITPQLANIARLAEALETTPAQLLIPGEPPRAKIAV